MCKIAIVYASVHHGNTKKLLEAITEKYNVELIDATKISERNLSEYDLIGFASGIYFSRYHQSVLNFAAVNLPQNKKVFLMCTYGASHGHTSMEAILKEKNATLIGKFGCKGYDTFGPFKLVGGIAKGHPDEKDVREAIAFFKDIAFDTV